MRAHKYLNKFNTIVGARQSKFKMLMDNHTEQESMKMHNKKQIKRRSLRSILREAHRSAY